MEKKTVVFGKFESLSLERGRGLQHLLLLTEESAVGKVSKSPPKTL